MTDNIKPPAELETLQLLIKALIEIGAAENKAGEIKREQVVELRVGLSAAKTELIRIGHKLIDSIY